MRMIDADMLENQLRKLRTDYEVGLCDEELLCRANKALRERVAMDCHLISKGVSQSIDKVRLQPTIEERKTGKWEEREVCNKPNVIEEWQSAQCSNCKLFHTTPYMYYFDNYKYCPNCGAKMDEVEE